LLGGAEAAIGAPGGQELLAALAVAVEARALQVRPLVPLDADPDERVLDLAGHRLVRALAVGVLDAQHEGATLAVAEEVVVDRRAHAADVEIPRGRGCEAHPHRAPNIRIDLQILRRIPLCRHGSSAPTSAKR